MKRIILMIFYAMYAGSIFGQQNVSGIVSSLDGESLPGVTILEKGTSNGTISDGDGKYSLSVSEGSTLVFSFIGFIGQEVPVGGRSVIDISLEEDVAQLDEVVVVGYGAMKRQDISGAVSSVQTKDLPQVANTSVNHLLQGRAPGLNISQRSTQPGGGLDINIRGAISPQGGTAPLYVIDGVPLFNNSQSASGLSDGQLGFSGGIDRNPLNTINPSDIESIDILKDASATAIYGASAANGVVLITTKQGAEGPVKVEYRGSYTVQTPKEYIDVFQAKEFMQQHNRLANDRYLFLNGLAPYGTTNPSSVAAFNPNFSTFDIQNASGTDWVDLMVRDGSIQEHNLSINGGTKNTKVYTAVNYYDNKSLLVNSNFERFTGRLNVSQQVGERIKIGINLTASQINSSNVSTGANSGGVEKYNMLQAAYSFSPTLDIFNNEGRYTTSFDPLITNPAAFLILDDEITSTRFFAAPKVEFKIIDELSLTVTGGIDKQNSQRGFYIPSAAQNVQFPNGSAQKSNNNIANYSAEAFLTLNKALGSLSLNAVVGTGYYRSANSGFNVLAVDFFTDAFEDDNLSAATALELSNFDSWKSQRNRQSLFSRVNLSYEDKYILTLTGRYDGDSEFASNQKTGFFPGASVAWRISEESFMNIPVISDLKLRAGVGQAGNPMNAGSAVALIGVLPGGYPIGGVVQTAAGQVQLANPNLTWETNETINIGLDFGFFSGRVNGSLEVYRRTAKDLLDFNTLPLSNEIVRVRSNVGSTRSQGIEFTLNSVNMDGPLYWSTTLTGTTYESFWVERNQAVPLAPWIKDGDPYTAIYGWRTDGIIQSLEDIPDHMPNANPGNIKYVDVDGDGDLDGDDVVLLGQGAPTWNLGLANTFRFKNFDLNFFFNAFVGNLRSTNSIGTGYNPNSPGDRLAINNMQNVPVEVRRVWTADNPSGDLPGLANDVYAGANPSGTHDFNMEKADFIRLRNITLGYSLPTSIIGDSFLNSVRMFVDVQNLAVFTNFSGFDPEFNETNPFPQALSTTVGINVGF